MKDRGVTPDAPEEQVKDCRSEFWRATNQLLPRTMAPAGMHMPFCDDDELNFDL